MRDNRNILLILLILSLLLSLLTIFVVAEGGVPTVSARSSALYEPTTKSFVYEKDADRRMPMASTTKIMTALIAIERCDLSEVVEIPAEATGIEGSSIYLKAGDVISVKDLIYSVLLQSANDAATALAILIGGDVKSFAALMNERAAELGLTNTSYENPHGLDSENHYTTARDLAILASCALENDTFKKITSTYKHSFLVSGITRTVFNHNKLLKRYDGCIGVKTGYTDRSGRCLVSAAEKDGLRLVAVTLNASDDWNDHTKLLDFGYSLFETIPLSELTALNFTVPVVNGEKELVNASVQAKYDILVHRSASSPYEARVEISDSVQAPVAVGDVIGTLRIYQGDAIVYSFPIVAEEPVTEKREPNYFYDILKELF